MTTSDAAKTRPKGREGTGITLRAFRVNAALNHLMFTGRRGGVYDRIVALSGVRPGDSVLDVGSSNGYLATRLAAAGPAIRVTGVDPSEPAIAYARRHARPGMTFTVGVAQHLNLPDASFDVVTCTLAMHHIPRRQRPAALAEMYRVTKPGGRLLTADLAPLLHFRGGGARRDSARPAAAQPTAAGPDLGGPGPGGAGLGGQGLGGQGLDAGDPLGDLAAAAGFQIESFGKLPLLHYIVAVRPQASQG